MIKVIKAIKKPLTIALGLNIFTILFMQGMLVIVKNIQDDTKRRDCMVYWERETDRLHIIIDNLIDEDGVEPDSENIQTLKKLIRDTDKICNS